MLLIDGRRTCLERCSARSGLFGFVSGVIMSTANDLFLYGTALRTKNSLAQNDKIKRFFSVL